MTGRPPSPSESFKRTELGELVDAYEIAFASAWNAELDAKVAIRVAQIRGLPIPDADGGTGDLPMAWCLVKSARQKMAEATLALVAENKRLTGIIGSRRSRWKKKGGSAHGQDDGGSADS